MATASQPTLMSMWAQPGGNQQAAGGNLPRQELRRGHLQLAPPPPPAPAAPLGSGRHPQHPGQQRYPQQGPRLSEASVPDPLQAPGHEPGLGFEGTEHDMSNPAPFRMLQGPVTRVYHPGGAAPQAAHHSAAAKPYGSLPPPDAWKPPAREGAAPSRRQGFPGSKGPEAAPPQLTAVRHLPAVPSRWADVLGASSLQPGEVRVL